MVRKIRREAERVVQVPIHGQCLAIVIVSKSETSTEHGFAVGRPSQSDPGLEVVLIPVVQWLSTIHWSRTINDNRVNEVSSSLAGGDAFCEILSQGDRRLDFEPLSLIYGSLKTVAQSERQRKVWTDSPRILDVSVIGLRREVAHGGRTGGQQSAILVKREVRNEFREPSDDRGASYFCLQSRQQRLPSVFIARQTVRS